MENGNSHGIIEEPKNETYFSTLYEKEYSTLKLHDFTRLSFKVSKKDLTDTIIQSIKNNIYIYRLINNTKYSSKNQEDARELQRERVSRRYNAEYQHRDEQIQHYVPTNIKRTRRKE